MKFCLDSLVLMSHGAARLFTLQCSVMPCRAITHQNLQILISQNMIFSKKKARHLKLVTLYKSCLINDNIMNGRFRPIKGHLMTG